MDCQIIAWRSQNFEPPILKSDLSNEVSRISSIGHFDWNENLHLWILRWPHLKTKKWLYKNIPKTLPQDVGGEIRRCSEILATNHTFRFQNPRFSGSKTTRPRDPACFFRRSCPGKLVGSSNAATPNQSGTPPKKPTFTSTCQHHRKKHEQLTILIKLEVKTPSSFNPQQTFRQSPLQYRSHPCVIRVPDWEFRNLQGSKKKWPRWLKGFAIHWL